MFQKTLSNPKSIFLPICLLLLGSKTLSASQMVEEYKEPEIESKLDNPIDVVDGLIQQGIQRSDRQQILYHLQQLSQVKPKQLENPLFLTAKLVDALGDNFYSRMIDYDLKVAIAQQATRYIHRAFVYGIEERRLPMTKEDQAELLRKISLAIKAGKEKTQPILSLNFELQLLRVAFGAFKEHTSKQKEVLEGMQKITQVGLGIGTTLVTGNLSGMKSASPILIEELKKAYQATLQAYREQWYVKILYINALRSRTLNQSRPLKERLGAVHAILELLQEGKRLGFTNWKTDDWQVFYAGLGALTQIITKSNEDELIQKAYDGSVKPRGFAYYADYNKNHFKSNWKVRFKAIEASILIQWALSQRKALTKIQQSLLQQAGKAITQRTTTEQDPRVLYILQKPYLILQVHQELQEKIEPQPTQSEKELQSILEKAIQKAWKENRETYQQQLLDSENQSKQTHQMLKAIHQAIQQKENTTKQQQVAVKYKKALLNLIQAQRNERNEEGGELHLLYSDLQEKSKPTKSTSSQPIIESKEDNENGLEEETLPFLQAQEQLEVLQQEDQKLAKWQEQLERGQWQPKDLLAFLIYAKEALQPWATYDLQRFQDLEKALQATGEEVKEIHSHVQAIETDTKEILRGQSSIVGLLHQESQKQSSELRRLYSEMNQLNEKFSSMEVMLKSPRNLSESEEEMLEKAIQQLIDTATKEIEQDTTTVQGLSLYVPLEAADDPVQDVAKEAKTLYNLNERVVRFLTTPEEGRLLLLQGNSGAGKSLYGRFLEGFLWNGRQPTDPIPLFISLPRTYDSPNYESKKRNLIEAALLDKKISPQAIDLLQQKATFVIFCDGFDEVKAKYDAQENVPTNFYKRFQLHTWRGSKFLVSCRSQILNNKESLTTFQVNRKSAQKVHLAPFSDQKVHTYVQHFANSKHGHQGWDEKAYEEALQAFPGLQEMIREPFSLGLVLKVLPKLQAECKANTRLTRAQLYAAFSEQWFENEFNRLQQTTHTKLSKTKIKQGFESYSKDLGFTMFIEKEQILKITEIEEEAQKKEILEDSAYESLDEEDGKEEEPASDGEDSDETPTTKSQIWKEFFQGEEAQMNLQGSPLRRVGPNQYMFIHKSYQEYFAAEKMVQEILDFAIKPRKNENLAKTFQKKFAKKIPDFSLNKKLLNDEPLIIRFIADRLEAGGQYTNLKERLYRILKASKRIQNIHIAAANAITILNASGESFADKNLQGIDIRGALLTHAFMPRANLSRANLQGVDLSAAYLEGANLQYADLDQANFGQKAYLEHPALVLDVAFSPDGNTLASASDDQTVRLWDPKSGKLLNTLQGHTSSVNGVSFSPDGNTLASASYDQTVRLWDPKSGKLLNTLQGHTSSVNGVSFSPDGNTLASASYDHTVRLWDPKSGKCLFTLTGHTSSVNGVSFSPDGNTLASCSGDILGKDNTVRLWDPKSGKCLFTLTGHTRSVNGVSFSPDGNTLASCSGDILGKDNTIRLWDPKSGKLLNTLQGHTRSVNGVSFSPDGNTLTSASDDQTVRLWDPKSGKLLNTLTGHTLGVNGVSFSPDGNALASASDDHTVRLWSSKSGKCLFTLTGHTLGVNGVSFSPDGNALASASDDHTVRLWDPKSGKLLNILTGHTSYVRGVRFSPDGNTLASASDDQTVRLWDSKSGKLLNTLTGHTLGVNGVSFSPDGNTLASASDDHTVRLWDSKSGKFLNTLTSHTFYVRGVSFSPDGNTLASASEDHTVRLWDPKSGKLLNTLTGHTDDVREVSFSPDGNTLASASDDHTVRLWDPKSGKLLNTLTGHTFYVRGVSFSPDGNTLASASDDHTVRLWDSKPGNVLRILGTHSLTLRGADFRHALGLTAGQKKLIQQQAGILTEDREEKDNLKHISMEPSTNQGLQQSPEELDDNKEEE